MRILILGGYGVFGGRLATLLSDLPDIEILICGRNTDKAHEFCNKYVGEANVTPITIARADIRDAIKKHLPSMVVDASGPFQDYGDNPYAVVKACIDAGVNYLDFADAADFVFGISQFDEDAKKASVYVLSGVSSFPVLTAAVLREMAQDMIIKSVSGGIAPSPYAGVGLNVMRAVVGYAGAPVKLLRNGVKASGNGLAESLRFTITPPGHLPLRNLHFSLVDVPDLQVIPPEHKSMINIWMGAAPVPEFLHRVLNLLAKIRAVFQLPSFAVFSPFFYWVLNLMKFGEHRGGMFVSATGTRNGAEIEKSWHLIAEGDDGPYIPSMAIEAIIRKELAGVIPETGARPATQALSLDDYNDLFKNKSIITGLRASEDKSDLIYPNILGSAFHELPKKVQEMHKVEREQVWVGKTKISRGKNIFARMIAGLVGFPPEAAETDAAVKLILVKEGERWERTFGGKTFVSHLSLGSNRNSGLLVERFGIVSVALALVRKGKSVYYVPRRWNVLGFPMPKGLIPSGESFEYEMDGEYRFNVTIKAPLIGLIVAYEGWLKSKQGTN